MRPGSVASLKRICGYGVSGIVVDKYSHLSNNRGGWNKRVGVQKLQNQLDFSIIFYAKIHSL